MERPIRFRAKLKTGFKPNETNSCWVYGNFIEGGGAKIGSVAEETICISTCVCDMHGNRAYEGDVIRILTEGETTVERDPTLYLIEWDSPRFGAFSPGHIKTVWDWGTFEIVGNIHDDPNLKTLFKENLK